MTLVQRLAEINQPQDVMIGKLVDDIKFWNDLGVFTAVELDDLLDRECYSNVFKDLHGFRDREPRTIEYVRNWLAQH